MARKAGFTRNAKAISQILHSPQAEAAVRAAAESVLARIDDPEAFISEYHTDRAVAGVNVPADKQAKHGIATRAAQAEADGR